MNKEFYQGFAVVIADLIRLYDYPTVSLDIMKSNGVTIKHLEKARVEKYDLDVIKQAIKG